MFSFGRYYGRNVWAIMGVLAMFVLVLSLNAQAFPRKVLVEDYTSTTCGPCANVAPAFYQALNEAGHELISSIAMHVYWPNPGNDPWYHNRPDPVRTRLGYYGINAVPWFVFDGTRYQGSATAAAFLQAWRTRAQTPSPLRITISAQQRNNTIYSTVEIESEQNLNNLTLHYAIVEKFWEYRGPSGQAVHYDAMLDMLPNGSGTQFNITSDRSLVLEFERSMEDLNWHETTLENIALIAWVQASNREVLQSENFSFSFNRPSLDVVGHEVLDSNGGNNDGRVEPGETGEIVLEVLNDPNYELAAEMVRIDMTVDNDLIEIVNGTFEIDQIDRGARVSTANSPFRFIVPGDFEVQPVTFNFKCSYQPGDFELDYTVKMMVGWPPFLMVNATGNSDISNIVMSPFGVEGLPWADSWDRLADGPAVGIVEKYDVVVWYSFNNTDDVMSEFESEFLRDYLDRGGRLVVSSHGLITNQGNDRLFREYMKVGMDEGHVSAAFVRGMQDNEFFSGARYFMGGGSGAGFPARKPSLTPLEGATGILFYESSGNNVGWCGVENVTDHYASLYLSFPIESVAGASGTDSFLSLANRIWNWSQQGMSVPDQNDGITPKAFVLNPVYPNPFNSQTVVPFSLDRNGTVRLALYAINGAKIAELVNGQMSAGSHRINLDANRYGLASGIYYLKLTQDGRTNTQKMLFIR